MRATNPAEQAALAALISLEHAACYGLAAGGGELGSISAVAATSARAATLVAFDQHRIRRDRLLAAVVAAGGTPPAALPAYTVPRNAHLGGVLAFLAALSLRSAAGYREQLGGLSALPLRTMAVRSVVEDARYAAAMKLAAGRTAAEATTALPGS